MKIFLIAEFKKLDADSYNILYTESKICRIHSSRVLDRMEENVIPIQRNFQI
uniref:Uncharacterized protein n=1 Tax=Arion vulgaris TaxID=1028688 RepID=A0A0B7BK23_9EUPU